MISFFGLLTRGIPHCLLQFPRMDFWTITIQRLCTLILFLEAIQELLLPGFVVEVSSPPHVVNPSSVSDQSFGKERLIMALRHANKHIWKEKFQFEDIRNA